MLADSMFSNNLYFYLFYLTTWFISLSIPYKFKFIDSFFVATMSILGLIKYYLYVWNVWILCSRSVHIEKLYHIYIFLIEYCKKKIFFRVVICYIAFCPLLLFKFTFHVLHRDKFKLPAGPWYISIFYQYIRQIF